MKKGAKLIALKKAGIGKEIKRKRRLKFSIQQKLLILFLLVSIIPAVGFTVYSALSLTESYTTDQLNLLDAISINKANAIETWYGERKYDCKLISRTPTLKHFAESAGTWGEPLKTNATIEVETLFLEMLEIYGTYNEMILLNTSGHVVAKANEAGYTFGHDYGEDVSHKSYYTYSYAGRFIDRTIFLSNIEWDDMVGKDFIAITISSPVHDDEGNFVGIVVFYIDSAYINDLLHMTQGLGTSGETYLTNFNGYWLTTSKFDYYIVKGLYVTLQDTIMTEQLTTAGIVEALTTNLYVKKSSNIGYRGIAVMGLYRQLHINSEGLPWLLVSEIDVVEALKVPNNLMIVSIWSTIIIAVVVAILGYSIAKNFIDPIIKLNSDGTRVDKDVLTDPATQMKDLIMH